ncbi:MAG: hypothetical protein FP825_05890 [Hyphomonas sp.]|uniref:DUF5694 domain-containing protein n=1 Tax=Hyphomonas sp. TaxID=87 RepID=UPI00185C1F3B|nr:DUF5694 domain-containing protein [Hyphomonas sp.]MBA3067999.1 hypothetical protein [Hyphomonas sp.]MBU4061337.1 hypothetical protein [Alphaproteobacteria bacterium]MBU4162590.1 hypothetical protein [Alphaproteobacteria bacterium]MBU4568699.1 hypothetical protein [Alphaproteobacteria bacterium]
MKSTLAALFLTAACASPPRAPAAAPLPLDADFVAAKARAFDPRDLQPRLIGNPTEVLVLGSLHLSGTPDGFDAAVLEPLLERLAAFKPDLIAIENLSGESIQSLKAYEAIYTDTAASYGGRLLKGAALAEAGLGLGLPEAEAEARRVLREWPAVPTPAERRHLAALFTAAGDTHSALVQWWRLPEAERIPGDGVSPDLAAYFQQYDTRKNESHQIAARLAARLGLERVYPADDHAADDVMTFAEPDLVALFEEAGLQSIIDDPANAPIIKAGERMTTPEQALETYRFLNTPEAGVADVALQWEMMLDRQTPNDVGRIRMAEWEARNLRQVAHIREAMAEVPGGRVLVIVGSAHKPWFDAYLGMMSDVKVVDAVKALE